MEQILELNTEPRALQDKPPVGSYEAMKPWFDEVDRIHEEFLRLERDGLLGE